MEKTPEEISATCTVIVTPENIRLLGRTYEKDDALYFNWTDSGFEFSFVGTKAEAEFITNKAGDYGRQAYLNVFIDGNEEPACAKLVALDVNKKMYTLTDNLPLKKHVVKVIKRTSNLQGGDLSTECISSTAAVTLLRITGGNLLTPPKGKKRKLEFIGDSITCGMSILGEGGTATEDGWQTYAANAARALNADFNIQAISGNGLICGVFGDKLMELPLEFAWTDRYNKLDEKWDFAKYEPDIVVINLGTNDIAGVGENKKFSKIHFEDTYVDFIMEIKTKYTKCKIIGTLGAMSETREDLFSQVVNAIRRANEKAPQTFAYSLQFFEDQANDGVGGAGHPSVKAQIKHGKSLEAFIRTITNWK